MRDRGLGREVDEGRIENVYRLQLMNSQERAHRYRIQASGIDTIHVTGANEVEVEPTATRLVPMALQVESGYGQPGSNRITVSVQALDDASIAVTEASTFFVPH